VAVRLKFIVAYDGSGFAGWQSQRGGRAVQDAIERAFAAIAGCPVRVHGSGRTDAGVHAKGLCFHADPPPTRLQPDDWIRALNATLPPTVRILKARQVPESFHARFSAIGKIYRYRIFTGRVLSPFDFGRVWHSPGVLRGEALRDATSLFVGRHDFSAFSAKRGGPVGDTRRTIHRIDVSVRGNHAALVFEGDGFLYKMVRMIAAACVRCCRGECTTGVLSLALRTGAPRWTHVAPAGGLVLEKVLYGGPSAAAAPDLPAENQMQRDE